jgi:hypothetical protein
MAHRIAPQAEAELDNIWYYVAKGSGSGSLTHVSRGITENH